MKTKDQFLPILKANVPARFVTSFSKNVLRPNNTFAYATPGRAERGDGLPVVEPAGGGRRAASLATPDASSRPTISGRSSPRTGTSSSTGSSTRSRSRRSRSSAPSRSGSSLGAARAHRIPVVSQITAVYVEVIRNTPILVQIFLIFYGLPQFGITLDAFTVAWLSVTIWGGAFNSENFRAGFLAVSHRHREAALALGFRPLSARSST